MNDEKITSPEGLPKIRTMLNDMGIVNQGNKVSDTINEKGVNDLIVPTISTEKKQENFVVEDKNIVEKSEPQILIEETIPKINTLSRIDPLPKNEPKVIPQRAPQSLRTFSDDLSLALRKTQGSIISIAIQEEERRNQEKPKIIKRDSSLVIISIGLITLALGSIFFVLSGKEIPFNKPVEVQTISEKLQLPITTNQVVSISLNNKTSDVVKEEVLNLINTTEPGITGIIFTNTVGESNKILSVKEFFSYFKINVPSDLNRGFDNSFLFGVYKDENISPFFILTPESFESALSGMLNWEETLPIDLYQFLNIKKEALGDNNFVFEDAVIENKDVRILNLETGESLFYLIYQDGTIFIATNKKIVEKITEKISIEGLK